MIDRVRNPPVTISGMLTARSRLFGVVEESMPRSIAARRRLRAWRAPRSYPPEISTKSTPSSSIIFEHLHGLVFVEPSMLEIGGVELEADWESSGPTASADGSNNRAKEARPTRRWTFRPIGRFAC